MNEHVIENGYLKKEMCLRAYLEIGALAGVTSLVFSAGGFSREWIKKTGRPPALTDLARGNNIWGNIYVASISSLATLLPIFSYALNMHLTAHCTAAAAGICLILTSVFEGNHFGKQHSNSLLAAAGFLSIWIFQCAWHGIAGTAALGCGGLVIALFSFLFSIRQNEGLKTIFILGEYVCLGLFIAALNCFQVQKT